jgi:hypothetical protein
VWGSRFFSLLQLTDAVTIRLLSVACIAPSLPDDMLMLQ